MIFINPIFNIFGGDERVQTGYKIEMICDRAMNLGLQVDAEILDEFLECDKDVAFELILIQPWKSR